MRLDLMTWMLCFVLVHNSHHLLGVLLPHGVHLVGQASAHTLVEHGETLLTEHGDVVLAESLHSAVALPYTPRYPHSRSCDPDSSVLLPLSGVYPRLQPPHDLRPLRFGKILNLADVEGLGKVIVDGLKREAAHLVQPLDHRFESSMVP